MNVASLELCQELFELSQWDGTDLSWYKNYDDASSTWTGLIDGANGVLVCPAYDLGYLLRQLPLQTYIKKEYDASPELPEETPAYYRALYDTVDAQHFWLGADTPEDADVRLAIELFKHGVLKREGYKQE